MNSRRGHKGSKRIHLSTVSLDVRCGGCVKQMNDEFKTLQKFDAGKGREGFLHSLPELEKQGIGKISRLPVSIRIVLESVLRNCDGKKVRRKDVETLANWKRKDAGERRDSIRGRADCFAGFHRRAADGRSGGDAQRGERLGGDPKIIEPLVPVDLVVDHSVQVDFFGSAATRCD